MFTPFMRLHRRFTGVFAVHAKLDALDMKITDLKHALAESNYYSAADRERIRYNERESDPLMELISLLHTKLDQAPFLSSAENIISLHGKLDNGPLANVAAISEKLDILLHHRHSTERTDSLISREVNRLDDYLNYHFNTFERKLDSGVMTNIVFLSEKLDALLHLARLSEPMVVEEVVSSPKSSAHNKRETLYMSPSLNAVLDVGGFDVIIPTSEIGILSFFTRHPFTEFEPSVQHAIRLHLKTGMVAIDCGVNVGLHSLLMAMAVGSEGSVIGIEAHPKLAEAASKTLKLNGLGRQYRMIQNVLADKECEVDFFIAEHSPISSLFPSDDSPTHPAKIKQTTLDHEVPPGSQVDLIKLDIEGAEHLAWRGMSRVLAENPNIVIIMEWSSTHMERSNVRGQDFLKEIAAAGFSGWILRDDFPSEPLSLDVSAVDELNGVNLLFNRSRIA